MELILVIIFGAVMAASGVTDPESKDISEALKTPQTEVVTPVAQELKPDPEPAKEPEPAPQPVKEPEPTPQPVKDPEPEPEPEEPKEEVTAEQTQNQDSKPEEEEVNLVQEQSTGENDKKGLSMLNIILYILGAIAVIAAGIYFFMRREPAPSAADIARDQSSSESTPEPQQEEPVQKETYSEPEPQQPAQEETQTESTQEETTSDNTDNSSSNDDENNNR